MKGTGRSVARFRCLATPPRVFLDMEIFRKPYLNRGGENMPLIAPLTEVDNGPLPSSRKKHGTRAPERNIDYLSFHF
jgi:hypothetical protein